MESHAISDAMGSGLTKLGLGFGIAVVLVMMTVAVFGIGSPDEKNYDGFAQCLTEKGLKMYGSANCGHCNSQKDMFGSSWQYVDYVECSSLYGGQTEACLQAGIRGYPTWVLPDGTQVLGRQSFERLSELSGCPLPA